MYIFIQFAKTEETTHNQLISVTKLQKVERYSYTPVTCMKTSDPQPSGNKIISFSHDPVFKPIPLVYNYIGM